MSVSSPPSASTLGLEGSDRELVEAFRTALPEYAPSLDVLLETCDDRYVPAGYPRAQV
jgi:hypothetical protein